MLHELMIIRGPVIAEPGREGGTSGGLTRHVLREKPSKVFKQEISKPRLQNKKHRIGLK